jgi:RNA polymerase-binding protein DksA
VAKKASSKKRAAPKRAVQRAAPARKAVAGPRKTAPAGAKKKAPTPPARKPVVVAPVNDAPPVIQKSGLTKRDIEQLKRMLMDKRAELVGDMTRMRDEALSKNRQDAAGNLSNMPIHMADIGTDNYEQEFTLGLLDSERAILQDIDDALRRIENRTYGVCAATGAPIGLARLRAQPWAKFCYEYMLQRERRQGGRY